MRKQLFFALFILLLTAMLVTAVTFASSNESPVVALDNSDLDPAKLAAGTQECPLCGKVPEKGWTPLDQSTYGETAYGSLGDGTHLYLAEDIVYTGESTFITAPTRNGELPRVACVHLNGHNLTTTQARAFMGSSGILNVMGNGTVTGGATNTTKLYRGSTVAINTNIATGQVCLYGGTYVKAETSAYRSVVSLENNGGCIRIFEGAEILCQPGENGVYVGTSNNRDSDLGLYGGIVTGGQIYIEPRNTEKPYSCSFTMADGQVDGGVVVGAGTDVTLQGAPVIGGSGLDLTSGVVIKLPSMKEGAAVRVKVGYGAFTQACDPAYAAYFTPTNSLIQIKSADGALAADAKDDCTADEVAPLCDGKTLKLLAIGNSFSNNATKYLYDIAKAEGIENVIIGRLYIGGCSLETHAANAAADAAEYTYYKNTAGKWVATSGKVTMLHGILDEDWDLITMQQASLYSGREETYNEDLRYLIDYVEANKTNPNAKLLWHMTWSYRPDSTKSGFMNEYENSQMRMYEMITECVRAKVIPNEEFKGILPVGTAIQNVRSSYIGDVLNEDTSHVNDLGEAIAAYTWYAALTDQPLQELKITNEQLGLTLTAGDRKVIVEAINNALAKPYEMTRSVYNKDSDRVDNSDLVFTGDSKEAFCQVCNMNVTWKAITGEESRVENLKNGDHLYLANDVKQTGRTNEFISVSTSGGTVCLHLNGHDLEILGNAALYVGNSTVNVLGNGTISGERNSAVGGATIQINSTDAVLNLFGGTYTKAATDTKDSIIRTGTSGGTINMYAPVVIDGANLTTEKDPTCLQLNGNSGKPSVFNLYGGTIKDGRTSKNSSSNGLGGNIRLKTADASFNMYGGTISGGYTDARGGNVYISNGVFNLYGGTITDGKVPVTTSNYGGNIYVGDDGELGIYGGLITPGKTGVAGRGVNIGCSGTVKMNGGLVTGGTTTGNGGNVYMLNGTFTIRKGAVENGSAVNGGNFYIYRGELSVMTISSVTGGSATGNGGNIYATYKGNVSMTSGTISGGVAGKCGGNIAARYLSNSETDFSAPVVTISGGKILDGNAGNEGGNIYLNKSEFAMSGGTISGGSGSIGDNVYLNGGAATMSGGKILGTACAEDHSSSVTGHQVGTAMYVNEGSISLSKSAKLYNDQLCGNLYIDGDGKLTVDAGWTGNASVCWSGDALACGEAIPEAKAVTTGDYTGTLYYEGNDWQPRIFGSDTTMTISAVMLQKETGSKTWYRTDAAALEAHLSTANSLLRVLADGSSFAIPEGKTLVLDVNGKQVTVTGTGTLRGMDSANDAYAITEGFVAVAETVTVEKSVPAGAGSRYLALAEENGYRFHRLDMRLTAVSLRTDACGLYYKAVYGCDAVLQERIDSFGVVLSTQDIPGADFMTEEGAINCYTAYDRSRFVSGAEVTSGSVFGIMKNGQKKNAQRGEMKIYANAYLVLDGETLVAEGDGYSLLDVLKAIDNNWGSYEASGEAATVRTFYQAWKAEGMDAWAEQLPNIAK